MKNISQEHPFCIYIYFPVLGSAHLLNDVSFCKNDALHWPCITLKSKHQVSLFNSLNQTFTEFFRWMSSWRSSMPSPLCTRSRALLGTQGSLSPPMERERSRTPRRSVKRPSVNRSVGNARFHERIFRKSGQVNVHRCPVVLLFLVEDGSCFLLPRFANKRYIEVPTCFIWFLQPAKWSIL